MRKYQPIWDKIRDTGSAKVVAPLESHARLIQAVRKEKVRDLGYKQQLLELGQRENLTVATDEARATVLFGLVSSSSILLTRL